MSMRSRRRDESGVAAVVYALVFLLLVGIAALSTDIGNAVSRRTSTQSQADAAALDAAQLLNASARAGQTPPTAIVDRVRDTLNENQPQNDGQSCANVKPTATCVTSAMLTDGDLSNGEIRYTSLGLQVISPRARVDFGLATALGFHNTTVASRATVNVFSPGKRVLPMFAVSGCDYGRQTLTDPASGPAAGTPNLALASNGPAHLSGITVVNASNQPVDHVPSGGTGYKVWVQASNWNKTSKLAFAYPDGTTSYVSPTITLATTHAAAALPWDDASVALEIAVPSEVASKDGVWYVIAKAEAGNKNWSPASEAQPVRVGQSVLECGAGPTSGNFGTMRLPRTDYPTSDDISLNIAKGFQDPLNLVKHDWGVSQLSVPSWDGTCVDGQHGAVVSSGSNLRDDTNCVDMDPGLPANVATTGFVTGVKQGATLIAPGLLAKPTVCNRNGGTASRSLAINPGGPYSINDDVLSCFLTGGHSLADIASPTYSGGPALSAAVLSSPRFAFVPVVGRQPANGSSNTYSVVDFRPAFITDEQAVSTAVKGSQTGTTDNGVVVQGNDVKQIKVLFFNFDALPRDGDIPLMEYLGIGKPIVHLVD